MPPAETPSFEGTFNQRCEQRLRYAWHMYYQHPEDGRIEEGRMVDLSRSGAAFLAETGSDLWPGKLVDLRLTHPMLDEDRFSILEVRRTGEVVRIEPHGTAFNCIAVKLIEPLDYDPVGNTRGVCLAAVVS